MAPRKPATKFAGPATRGLRIVSRRESFNRCGRQFGIQPVVIPLSELTEDEVERLTTEAQLVAVEVDIEAAEPSQE